MHWLEGLSDHDRRALVLGHAYERSRRQAGQHGYTIFGELETAEIIETPIFKQLRTIVLWLKDQGWKVTWSEVHWQGFVEFTFDWMAPVVPMPGQLKNRRLLAEYIKGQPVVEREPIGRYTRAELEALYVRKLRPELRNRGAVLAALRLRQL